MNLIDRWNNLWKLSSYEPGQATDEYKTAGTKIAMIVKKLEKKRQSAIFVPHVAKDPIQELVNETP